MRVIKALGNDIRFQYKYGFYLLYIVISIIYIGVLLAMPTAWRGKVLAVVIFSDPAALGFFFMGAVILFEKSERVLNSISISPLKINEYIFSKVLSLSIISTLVGCLIAAITTQKTMNIASLVLGVASGSALFSLAGLIVAASINSLNQFMLKVIPIGVALSVPAFLILFGFNHILLQFHPGVIVLEFILQGVGLYEINNLLIVVLIGWIALFWLWAKINVKKMMDSLGGVKL